MLTGEKEDDIFQDVYGGFLLGKTQFIKEKLKELKTQVESDKISYNPYSGNWAVTCRNT